MVTLAVKPSAELSRYPPTLVPKGFTLAHFSEVFSRKGLFRYTFNSFIIAGSTTLVGLVLGVPAAYGLVRLRRQSDIGMAILISRMLPGLLCLIPWYRMFVSLRLIGTYTAIVLTHLVYAIPLIVWILLGYFEDQDRDLEAAALVDGCTRYGAFLTVGVPLALPGITVCSILTFVVAWNDFVRGLIFAGVDKRPLTMAIFMMMQFETVNWGPLAAAAFVVVLPVLLVTLLLQGYIVAGLSSGGVKG